MSNIVERMIQKQSATMRQHVPERPTITDLQLGVDLIMGEGLVALNEIINSREEEADVRIRAVSSATNIARYLETRKQYERDSKEISVEFDDEAFMLGRRGDDGDS